MEKKKHNFILKLLGVFFLIYVALFIANASGYYEARIKDKVVMTEKGIKEFEEKVINGEEVDVTSFLKTERIDYSNGMSRFGDDFTKGVEKIISNGSKIFKDIFKSLF